MHGGRLVRPLRLEPGDVQIEAIAHSLANTCRFTGHCRWHYSVAQHSVFVCGLLWREPVEVRLAGLLHDSPEHLIGDLAGPTKRMTPLGEAYRLVEAYLEPHHEVTFGLPIGAFHDRRVKEADMRMQLAEGAALLPPHPWTNDAEPHLVAMVLENRWQPVPEMAESQFLTQYEILTNERRREDGSTEEG